jgi:hypothetical protein
MTRASRAGGCGTAATLATAQLAWLTCRQPCAAGAAAWLVRKKPATRGAGRYQREAGVERGLAAVTNSVASKTPRPNGVASEIR